MNGDLSGESDQTKDTPLAPEEQAISGDQSADASTPVDEESEHAVMSGAVLKQIRERREITLQAIAEETKIGMRSLKALEDEAFEELPNARVYIRGFIRCYAEEVGLDPDRVESTYLPRWEAWAETEKEQAKPKFPGSPT